MVPLTKGAAILPRVMSDHSLVLWSLRNSKKNNKWSLNDELLGRKENVEYLQKEIEGFFEFNWDRETKNFVVWDAFKASFEVF